MKTFISILFIVYSVTCLASIDIKGKSSTTIDGKPPKMTVNCKGKAEDCVTSSSIRMPDGSYALKVQVYKDGSIFKTVNASSMRVLTNTETETKVEFLIIE
jgi:hypothetical protein